MSSPDITTPDAERRSAPAGPRTKILVQVLLALSLAVSGYAQLRTERGASEENVPEEVNNCVLKLHAGVHISRAIDPFYLRGDFDGNGKADYAVLIRKGERQGIAVCLSGARPTLLGANNSFHGMTHLNFEAWQIHPRARGVEKGVGEGTPPSLRADAILLEWESASGLIYWNGRKFVWYQQGD